VSLITLKSGVIVSQQVVIACAIVNAANDLDLPNMVITSGRDGQHMEGSFHYRDRALDFRTKHLAHDDKHALLARIKQRLGPGYDVILENLGKAKEHGHAEYDPA